MYYPKLSNEELNKYPFPNLMAEIIESGYSICTVSEHMGLGCVPEDDPVIWAKLKGEEEVYASEIVGMANLFGVKVEYLFSKTLETINGVSKANIRWSEWNEKEERDFERSQAIEEINRKMRNNPDFLEFVKLAATLTNKQLNATAELFKQARGAR